MELKFKHLTAALLMAGIACTQASAKDLYLSATGDDSNDGLSAATAVKTLGRLNEIMERKATIYVSGMIDVSAEKPAELPEKEKWNGDDGKGGGQWVQTDNGKHQGFNISSRNNTLWKGLTFIGEDPHKDGFTGNNETSLFIFRGKEQEGTKFYNLGFIDGISNINGGTLVFRDQALVEFNNCYFAGHHPDWNSFKLEGNEWKRIGGDNEKGGVIHTQMCQLTFNSCLFENNAALQGGAMYICGTDESRNNWGWINIKDCIFRDNVAKHEDKLLDNSKGGAIAIYPSNQDIYLNIDGCLFENNETRNQAGAIWIYDELKYGHYSDITIANSAFYGNHSYNGEGGAILFQVLRDDFEEKEWAITEKVKIINTTFAKNRARSYGGAIYFHGAAKNSKYDNYPPVELWMVNCTMIGNETEGNAGHGAAYREDGQTTVKDGKEIIRGLPQYANRYFYNCIFEGNYALHVGETDPKTEESDFDTTVKDVAGLYIHNSYFGRFINHMNTSNKQFFELIGAEGVKYDYADGQYKGEESDAKYFLAGNKDVMGIYENTRNHASLRALPFFPIPNDSELRGAGDVKWMSMEDTFVTNPVKGNIHPLSGYDITKFDQLGYERDAEKCAIGAATASLEEIMAEYGIESLIPVAPELPELITDGLDIDEEFIKGEDTVSILFKEVEGIDIYYLIGEKVTEVADEAADEAGSVEETEDACTEDHTGYTKYDGNALELTSAHSTLTVFACDPKNSLHSEAKTYKLEIATGIEGIEAVANSKALYFNLQGVQVENPENGVFIRVSNGKATKVVK